ncbi:Remorin_C domain-containing protein [Psidium guajava]|nr:Remorin_C domain-containing protein [Psidium guajava]
MAEEEKKAESQAPPPPPPPPPTLPSLPPPPPEEKTSRAKTEEKEAPEKNVSPAVAEKYSLAVPRKVADPVEKNSGGSIDRDAVLARVETEKRLALIRAWEESEKTKVENKTYKKLSGIGAWENTKRAAVEAELKKMEENLEKKKAEHAELMKNKIAEIHKAAEEKRAMIEAKKGESFLKIEETAAKFRATGYTPRKLLGCCTS